LHRTIRLDGSTLHLIETVSNTSPQPLEIMWSHHPAFGAPFLEAGCRLATGARTLIADDEAPGTLLEAGSEQPWPVVELSEVPGPDEPRSVLAYLTDFEGPQGWFRLSNPRLGLEAELRWPTEIFPSAWLWQELRSTPGFPWWQEAYVCAVEPASTIPGQGIAAARAKGSRLITLDGHSSRTVDIEATLHTRR
jgi:hypothetical protein